MFSCLSRVLLLGLALAAVIFSLTDAFASGLVLVYPDKTLHVIGYAGFTLVAILSWPQHIYKMSVFVFIFSIVVEIFQHWHPTRGFHINDIAANAIGIGMVLCLSMIFKSAFKAISP